jgi:hypothetical protein
MLKVFNKIKLGSRYAQRFLAFVTLICGFSMMWGSSRGSFQSNSTNQSLRAAAVQIDPLLPNPSNNGAIVVAAAKFASPEEIEDELIKPGPYLILRRRVEMYQWHETKPASGGAPEYYLDWADREISFFQFKESSGHENYLFKYDPKTQRVKTSSFGVFDGSYLLAAVQRLLPLDLTTDILKDTTFKIEDNKIYIPRNQNALERPAVGDMRVWYEGLKQGEYTVLTRQVDERNLIGSGASQALVLRVGLLDAEALFDLEESDSEKISNGLLYLGGTLFFLGLFSILMPFAAELNLRPKINLEGAPALALVCAAISAAAVVVFFIVGQLN